MNAAAKLDDIADPLDRVSRHIEANAFDALNLDALAEVAGLSTYHFARQFTARHGLSPMAYVRARRMALAAGRLCGAAPPALIQLAFDCGFESQEGFTRAFKRAFGVSPGRYRRATPRPSGTEIIMTAIAKALNLTMEPAPQLKPAFRVAGVSGVFNQTDKAGIPLLWNRLMPHMPVTGQASDRTFGVCCEAPGGEEGCMTYMAAVPLAADAPDPAGLEVMEVPEQTYLVFRQALDGSDLHPQMQAAAQEIWAERLPKSGYKLARGPDLEAYPEHFDPTRGGQSVEWWIPVQA